VRWSEYERDAYLRGIDEHWREHLRIMDGLKEGVYLEAYAQKDPKLIYKKEGHELFQQMIARIEIDVVEKVFQVEVKSAAELDKMKAEAELRRAQQLKQLQEHHHAQGLHEEVEAQLADAAKVAQQLQQAQKAGGNAAGMQAGPQGQRRQVSAEELAQIQAKMAADAKAKLDAMPAHKREQLENRAALMRRRAAQTVERYGARKAALTEALRAAGAQPAAAAAPVVADDDDDDGPELPRRAGAPKIGRNDACWCGSGLKYKKCHMESDSRNA
jgi:preprotein translocase subunit SecA